MAAGNGLASLVVLALFAAPGTRAEGPGRQTLAIVTEFERGPSPGAAEAMREEIARVFRRLGLNIVWEDLSQAAGRSVHDRMVVVRFRGRCDGSGLPRAAGGGPALAFTHVANGGVLPFAEVNCDRIRFSLSRAVPADFGRDAERAFGRASARVLAHEIYHMLARTMDHGCRGIAKPQLAPHELVAAGFGFDDPDLARMRESLFERRLASAAAAAPSAP